LQTRLLNWLGDAAAIGWSTASVDSLSVRQGRGGQTGPNPVDHGQTGSKYHLVVVRKGIPFAVRLSAANAHDAKQLLPLVHVIPPIIGPCGRPGRPRKRAVKRHSEKAYDASTTLASMASPTDRRVAESGTDCG
jgi:hypothetical protein